MPLHLCVTWTWGLTAARRPGSLFTDHISWVSLWASLSLRLFPLASWFQRVGELLVCRGTYDNYNLLGCGSYKHLIAKGPPKALSGSPGSASGGQEVEGSSGVPKHKNICTGEWEVGVLCWDTPGHNLLVSAIGSACLEPAVTHFHFYPHPSTCAIATAYILCFLPTCFSLC